jgi:predicted transposase/invertase (TIGR01784 family)
LKEKFISPLADFIVKDVFGTQKNIGNTERLLKAVLDLDAAEYKSMKIVDPHLHRRFKKDKLGVVDIKINTRSGKVLHIEVQVNPDRDLISRGMYYNDRLVVDQIGAGKWYKTIRRSISVIILNFTLLKDEPPDRYKNVYRFLNMESHRPLSDLQEIIILELPKVPWEDDGTGLWPWLKYFKCETMEDLTMLAKEHEEVSDAVWQIRRMSPLRAIREMIFEYEDAKRIKMGQDAYVREEGREEGREQGREQGYQEAEAKYQEQIRRLEEENRRLRGE